MPMSQADKQRLINQFAKPAVSAATGAAYMFKKSIEANNRYEGFPVYLPGQAEPVASLPSWALGALIGGGSSFVAEAVYNIVGGTRREGEKTADPKSMVFHIFMAGVGSYLVAMGLNRDSGDWGPGTGVALIEVGVISEIISLFLYEYGMFKQVTSDISNWMF